MLHQERSGKIAVPHLQSMVADCLASKQKYLQELLATYSMQHALLDLKLGGVLADQCKTSCELYGELLSNGGVLAIASALAFADTDGGAAAGGGDTDSMLFRRDAHQTRVHNLFRFAARWNLRCAAVSTGSWA